MISFFSKISAILFAILTKHSLVEYFIPLVLFPPIFSLPPDILLFKIVDLNNRVVHDSMLSTGKTLCQKEEGEDRRRRGGAEQHREWGKERIHGTSSSSSSSSLSSLNTFKDTFKDRRTRRRTGKTFRPTCANLPHRSWRHL